MSLKDDLQTILNKAVDSGEECGCQLAVYRRGDLLFDLSAGYTDESKERKVDSETLFPVFSVGKGIATTIVHILAERGKIDYDAPVSTYWPEYACAGKEETKVWHILTHRAGLFNDPPELSLAELFDWKKTTRALASAAPKDKIGGIHHYHAETYGILAGRLAELADGRDFRTLLREEILEPLGIGGIHFGLSGDEFENLAKICGKSPWPGDFRIEFNRREILSGLNPSSNGTMNARSLAKVYASLTGNGAGGVRLLKPGTVENATVLRRAEEDILLPSQWDKFGLGYALCGPADNFGRMFGHGGACGAEGFADKETGYAVGFTKNKLNRTHPDHPTRNEISRALGLPERIW